MDYERPAIVRRVPVSPPVIEGAAAGSGGVVAAAILSPVWQRDDTDAPGE